MSMLLKYTSVAILYLVTIGAGIWLSHLGRPYSLPLLTVHKLSALGSVIFIIVIIYGLVKNVQVQAPDIVLFILTALFFICLFVTGALLSIDRPVNSIILTIHYITPILATIAAAAALYLLVVRR